MTTEELRLQIKHDRQILLDTPFQLRNLAGMASGNWIIAADRQRGKSCALAQLIYQRTQQREDRRMYGVEPIVLSFRNEIYRRTTAHELLMILSSQITEDKILLCLDDVDLLEGWPQLLTMAAVAAPNIKILATMSTHSARQITGNTELRDKFNIKNLADFTLHEYLRVSKLSYNEALNRFIRRGGFPGVLLSAKRHTESLERLFRTLFYEELLPRYTVRNETALRMILHLLAEHLGEEISYNGLCRMLQETGLKVGVSTVVEYISILEKTRFIRSIECFSAQTIRTPKRHYWFVDNGLLSLFIPATQLHEKLLRNIMTHAVLQKYQKHTIYYASQRNASVDFYIPERDIAIVLCPNDELIPDAVQNFQRLVRKHPTTHKCIYTVGKISDSLPRDIFNRFLPEWSSSL